MRCIHFRPTRSFYCTRLYARILPRAGVYVTVFPSLGRIDWFVVECLDDFVRFVKRPVDSKSRSCARATVLLLALQPLHTCLACA